MKYCSLGETCQPANTLKSLGLKNESYPFDWTTDKSEIIKSCLEDDFKTFLDRSLYLPSEVERSCYHGAYVQILTTKPILNEQIFFRHRDPLHNDEDYNYYVRCVDRFRKLLASDDKKIFIKTYLHKQANESCLEDAASLAEFLGSYTTNYKIIAVRHAITGTQSFNVVEDSENLLYIDITTIDDSDGGSFMNHTDISFFNSLLGHFINKVNEIW